MPLVPPTSRVSVFFSMYTFSSGSAPYPQYRFLMWRSIRIADCSSAVGLAMSFPAMSGPPLNGFKDCAAGAEVCAGDQTQAAHKGRAQVAHNIAIQVFREQGVVLVRFHHQLHAGVVNDVLA